MTHEVSMRRMGVAALLLGIAMSPAHASEPCPSFEKHDADRNGYLSMEEFKAQGRDDLAFRAADLDGDGRVDADEFDRYVKRAKAAEPPAPAKPSGGY